MSKSLGKLRLAAIHAVDACIRHPSLRWGNNLSEVIFNDQPGKMALNARTDTDQSLFADVRIELGSRIGFNVVRVRVILVNTAPTGEAKLPWAAECLHDQKVGYVVSSMTPNP